MAEHLQAPLALTSTKTVSQDTLYKSQWYEAEYMFYLWTEGPCLIHLFCQTQQECQAHGRHVVQSVKRKAWKEKHSLMFPTEIGHPALWGLALRCLGAAL